MKVEDEIVVLEEIIAKDKEIEKLRGELAEFEGEVS